MDLQAIVSATLGLPAPWRVSNVSLTSDGQRLDITVAYDLDLAVRCPRCGATGAHCQAESEIWVHRNFLCYKTYLHAIIPQRACCGNPHMLERPWARSGSQFCLLPPATGDTPPVTG